MTPLGTQIIADFYECAPERLDDPEAIRAVMLEAAQRARVHVVGQNFHHFSPQGVSGVLIIAESHLAIHTWPEHRYAAVDLFTCGEATYAQACLLYLKEVFQSGHHTIKTLQRGLQRTQEPQER